jgi:hypothetical protein
VPYQVVPGLTIALAHLFNGTQKPWRVQDYALSYAALGNKEYQQLLKYMDETKWGLRTLIVYLSGMPATTAMRRLKDGTFEIRGDKEYAEKLIYMCEDLSTKGFEANSKFAHEERFQAAVLEIIERADYDHTGMLEKLENTKFVPQPNRFGYLKELERVYNWKSRYYTRFV